MKRYLYMPDTRSFDDWGLPVGKLYERKDWDELTPDEMMADFEWKSDVLAAYGDEIGSETFYQDYLFRELYQGELGSDYKVLLTVYDAASGNKVHKISVDEIQEYLLLNDVALSPCLFHSNWRRKSLLNYIGAFVLDIDKLRPAHLQRFISLFDQGRLLRPTFIANSGSGVHFYYMLDRMLPCDSVKNEANNLIAAEVYKRLYDDVIKREKWTDAQRHWIGQDYRVINSRTKLGQVSQIFRIGDTYSIEDLIQHYNISIDPKKHYASKRMISYAQGIAKDLQIDPPDFEDAKMTYKFIRDHKDAAYAAREARRQERAKIDKKKSDKPRKPGTWYRNTLHHMRDHTSPGYRFSSLKALAIIAYKEKVPESRFLQDLNELVSYWEDYDWKGDKFNSRNAEAIVRLYRNGEKYGNVSSETLEEWLGYEFKRIGVKRNGRKRADHVKVMNAMKDLKKKLGETVNEGRPSGPGDAAKTIWEWRMANPDGIKAACVRDTGLSKPTVYKWWNFNPEKQNKDINKLGFGYPGIPEGIRKPGYEILFISEENELKKP